MTVEGYKLTFDYGSHLKMKRKLVRKKEVKINILSLEKDDPSESTKKELQNKF